MSTVILNFTSNFNLNDVASIVLSTGANNLLFFEELASVEHEDVIKNEVIISNRLRKFKNLLREQSLSYESSDKKLRVICFLNYDKWNFLGHGDVFNGFPPFKTQHIISLLEELVPQYKEKMSLYFMVLSTNSKPFSSFFDSIENNFLKIEGVDEEWFYKENFNYTNTKKSIQLNQLNENDLVKDNQPIDAFLKKTEKDFFETVSKILKRYSLGSFIPKVQNNYQNKINQLSTVADFSPFDFDSLCIGILINYFTYETFIKEGAVFFKIPLGETAQENTKSKVICASLVHLLSIIPEKDNVFKTQKCALNFSAAKLSEENLHTLFSSLRALNKDATELKKSNITELEYTHYELKPLHASQTLEINVRENIAEIKKPLRDFSIPLFFNYNKAVQDLKNLSLAVFENIEKKVLETKEFVMSKISEESLKSTSLTGTAESIKAQLLTMAENPVKVNSTIDFEGYIKEVNMINTNLNEEKMNLAEKLMFLAKRINVFFFCLVVVVILLLLYWPVYLFYHTSLLPAAFLAFTALVCAASAIAYVFIRKKITGVLRKIETCYEDMANNLERYYKSICETSGELAAAIVYKANYEELSRVLNNFNVENLKVDKWKSFLNSLNSNNILIEKCYPGNMNTEEVSFEKNYINKYYCIPDNVIAKIKPVKTTIIIKTKQQKEIEIKSFLEQISFETY